MSSLEAQTTKRNTSYTVQELRVLNNLVGIINREVLAGNPSAIAMLKEAMS